MLLTKQGDILAQDSFVDDSVQIEEVTVTAAKQYKNIQAGTTIIALDSLALNNRLSGSLADVLSQNSTIFIKSYGGGSVATASIRGTGASHTTLMWNGMPINSPMTGQADFSLIPVYFIDEANILMGAASLLNVGGALGGGVTVDNKPDWNKSWQGKFIQGYGSFNTYTEFGQFGWSNNLVFWRSRAFYESSDNNFEYHNKYPNVDEIGYYRQKNSNYHRGGMLHEAYLKINPKSVVSIKYWYQNKESQIPKLLSSSPKEHDEVQDDQNQRLIALWQNKSEEWDWYLTAGYADDINQYLLKNIIAGTFEAVTNYDVKNHTQILFNQAQAQYTSPKRLKLSFQLSDNYSVARSNEIKRNIHYKAHLNEASLLGAAYQEIGNRLSISFLLRQHIVAQKMIKPTPSLGAEYRVLAGKLLNIKFNLSRNYHHPSLNDYYYQPGGNPDLKPEQGTTTELGLTSNNEIINTSINGYYTITNDWILWEPSQFGYWIPKNIQTVHSRGIETHMGIKVDMAQFAIKIDAKYAFTLTTNQSDSLREGDERRGKQLIYIPKHTANAMLNVSYRKYDFNWVSYAIGARQTSTSNDEYSEILPAYFLNNISIGRKFYCWNAHFDIQMKADNIFNTEYNNVIDRPMPGRSYWVLVKFVF